MEPKMSLSEKFIGPAMNKSSLRLYNAPKIEPDFVAVWSKRY